MRIWKSTADDRFISSSASIRKTILTEDRSRALFKEIQYQFVSVEPCYIL